MKYFTFELWNSDNHEDELTWKRNLIEYKKQMNLIRDRISKKTYFRLCEKGFHDYKLKNFKTILKKTKKGVEVIYFFIQITDGFETWEIKYNDIRQLTINYNG